MSMDPELEEKIAEVVEEERDMGSGEEATELEDAVEHAEAESVQQESGQPATEETSTAGAKEPAEEAPEL